MVSNKRYGAQSDTHVSLKTYSNNENLERFFDDVGLAMTQFHSRTAAVSIFTEQERQIMDFSSANECKNKKFTEALGLLIWKQAPKNTNTDTHTAFLC